MAESSESSFEFPVPPASFSFLVESILMQTQIQLGLLNLGEKEEEAHEPNLPLARHSIDLLAMLQGKTKGNLSAEEQRLLENGLTELRFRYVQVADEIKKRAEPEGAAASSDDAPRIITADGGKGTKTG
ncbi:MAG: DUF1844 domain-containing protein [Acidobacteriaceae bacterium]|nr:DUF1844 domain-containing protein [Acidobacteriaceae bacterium]MBV9781413.1 DUF1844 domain-containing protein [Acidobacteriaceae bacterium]